jgi:hypothetical protein
MAGRLEGAENAPQSARDPHTVAAIRTEFSEETISTNSYLLIIP